MYITCDRRGQKEPTRQGKLVHHIALQFVSENSLAVKFDSA
jgi:hypothetical protein